MYMYFENLPRKIKVALCVPTIIGLSSGQIKHTENFKEKVLIFETRFGLVAAAAAVL